MSTADWWWGTISVTNARSMPFPVTFGGCGRASLDASVAVPSSPQAASASATAGAPSSLRADSRRLRRFSPARMLPRHPAQAYCSVAGFLNR